MLSFDEARERMLKAATPLPAELIATTASLGRCLVEPLVARYSLPPFDNSAMDGYALRAVDTAQAVQGATPTTLPLVAPIPAGTARPPALFEGHAARIFTGAPMPPGADAVVMQERCSLLDTDRNPVASGAAFVCIDGPVQAGDHLRPRGDDIEAGQQVLEAGQRMGSLQIAAALSQGRTLLRVVRRPRVAIFGSGDELVEADRTPGEGQIISTNSLALGAACEAAGGLVTVLGTAADDPQALRSLLDQADGADLILTSGGVSVGDHDHLREVMQGAGFEEDFWKLAMKPGKPVLFGRLGARLVVGLPGNPVSALLAFMALVRPMLRKMQALPAARLLPATLEEGTPKASGRTLICLVSTRLVEGRLLARPLPRQASHRPSAVVKADAMVVVPPDHALPSGTDVLLEEL